MNKTFKSSQRAKLFAILACCSLVLAGCGGGGSNGASFAASNSSLSLGITDAPVDGVTAVKIVFTKVHVHSARLT